MDFKLHLIETITDNFSEDKKVGSGGYGDVYRVMHAGEEIAVKKLHPLQGLDDKQFHNEFRNLSKVRHKNIVRIIAYCYESRHKYREHKGETIFAMEMERVLCFEYMQGGSLDKHISDESCGLDWPTCYKIIRGTCDGLNHLHNGHEEAILHLDLKPANILLDKSMTPKIADLGLSKLVSSSITHKTEIIKGTQGYMPPEYVDSGLASKKFDVFSLGVIIIKMMAGNIGNSRRSEMPPKEFIEHVSENWKEKLLQASPGYSSHGIDILRVRTCVEIALRCVESDRNKRPRTEQIVHELEKLENEIKKISQRADRSKDSTTVQRSCDTNILAVDPTLELRFLFVPRKEVSCCLQLTNKTDGFIAFNIKIDQSKYHARPSRGTMPPCSKRYISVALRAQEEAPPNMRCHDMILVQSIGVSQEVASKDGEINYQELFETAMAEKVVDVVQLPIVYVVLLDQ